MYSYFRDLPDLLVEYNIVKLDPCVKLSKSEIWIISGTQMNLCITRPFDLSVPVLVAVKTVVTRAQPQNQVKYFSCSSSFISIIVAPLSSVLTCREMVRTKRTILIRMFLSH